jgi:hypothetical protein
VLSRGLLGGGGVRLAGGIGSALGWPTLLVGVFLGLVLMVA